MAQTRKLASQLQIRKHWAQWLVDKGKMDSITESMEKGICFACGYSSPVGLSVERCHITAKCNGGSDTADNLHNLCSVCHKASESKEGDDYFEWYDSWTQMDYVVARAVRSGVPVGQIITEWMGEYNVL